MTSAKYLRNLGLNTIKELETDDGILASSKEDLYGCIFGRDSLITSLKLLKAYEESKDTYLLALVKKILTNLAALQGREFNIESGEEPGKIIHEYRPNGHEHLTQSSALNTKPWYVYPDQSMKSYDSVDSTPLFLMAVAKFMQVEKDLDFEEKIKDAAARSLRWLLYKLETDKPNFLTYEFPDRRQYGGLATQSWMDSVDSIFHENGSPTPYPIAPVEAQAYAYCALRLWGQDLMADRLKERFNRNFVFDEEEFNIAFALDGLGTPMLSLRSSIGHLLWSTVGEDGEKDQILAKEYIPKLVNRLMSREMFEHGAGIRTLSKLSRKFDPRSYHNGSIWPHDNAIIAEGFKNFGFEQEAKKVRLAMKKAWKHFDSPIEFFVFVDGVFDDSMPSGQRACYKQAWSAASILSEIY
jgi:glycogen debranching enzyme